MKRFGRRWTLALVAGCLALPLRAGILPPKFSDVGSIDFGVDVCLTARGSRGNRLAGVLRSDDVAPWAHVSLDKAGCRQRGVSRLHADAGPVASEVVKKSIFGH